MAVLRTVAVAGGRVADPTGPVVDVRTGVPDPDGLFGVEVAIAIGSVGVAVGRRVLANVNAPTLPMQAQSRRAATPPPMRIQFGPRRPPVATGGGPGGGVPIGGGGVPKGGGGVP